MAETISIDNVPMAFVCTRANANITTERKFKAKCGSKVTFVLASNGTIKRLEYGRETCKDGCIYCDVMAQDAKKIIIGA